MKIISEGSIKLKVPETEKISKEMGVFYNPVMSFNRDISVLLVDSVNKTNLQVADPLAATGVRSIRFLKELNKNKIKSIHLNDCSKDSIKSIIKNLKLNKINYKNNKKIIITNEDANLFLLKSSGFDYIDIDPFGSPNFLLNNAVVRLARDGILAVTATDTSALCGTYINACKRKYWALPSNNAIMHETGLRILIRKVQLVAAQYGKALTPIFSYSKEHYMRTFLRNEKGKNKADDILKLHGMLNNIGPMWLGKLWGNKLTLKIYKNALKNKIFNKNKELIKFLRIVKEESRIDAAGFYDLHDICEKNKIKNQPKKEPIIEKIKNLGYRASGTHFKGEGIRSSISYLKLANLLKNK